MDNHMVAMAINIAAAKRGRDRDRGEGGDE